jgi:hypothetical protein
VRSPVVWSAGGVFGPGTGLGEAIGVGAGLDDGSAEGFVGGYGQTVLLLAFGQNLEQQLGAAPVFPAPTRIRSPDIVADSAPPIIFTRPIPERAW